MVLLSLDCFWVLTWVFNGWLLARRRRWPKSNKNWLRETIWEEMLVSTPKVLKPPPSGDFWVFGFWFFLRERVSEVYFRASEFGFVAIWDFYNKTGDSSKKETAAKKGES